MPDVKQTLLTFGSAEQHAALRLIEAALAEDLGDGAIIGGGPADQLADVFSVTTIDSRLDEMPSSLASELDRDLTCAALIDRAETATINVVVRRDGILAGGPVAELVFGRLDPTVAWESLVADGTSVTAQTVVARASGSLRSLLIGERTALNFLMHLSGVATQTWKFVDAVAGTKGVILDTRKTLPGWRALEKYAVRCGGGTNHRMGLHDGVLIKDNHLAAWIRGQGLGVGGQESTTIANAVRQARSVSPSGIAIEVEVDSLEQLRDALTGGPEIVLLDNMGPAMLRAAVALIAGRVPTEASGGVNLATIRAIADTGVTFISVGRITQSAPAADIGLDFG